LIRPSVIAGTVGANGPIVQSNRDRQRKILR
jgi:hypothetical protein